MSNNEKQQQPNTAPPQGPLAPPDDQGAKPAATPWEEAKKLQSEAYDNLLAIFSETHTGDTDLPSGDGWKRVRCEAKPENASFVKKRAAAGWEIDEESMRKDVNSWVLKIRQETYDQQRQQMLDRIGRLTQSKVANEGGELNQIKGATADDLINMRKN